MRDAHVCSYSLHSQTNMAQIESIFWGIIAALGALVIELIFFIVGSVYFNPSGEMSFSQFFILPQFIIIAACIEELFKYIVISKRIDMLSLEKSYLVNSLLAGLGFFGVEIAFILMGNNRPEVRFLAEIAIIHIGNAGLIGYFVATKNPKKIMTFLQALFFALLFHASYNLLVLERGPIQNYIIFALLGLLAIINIANFFRISHKLAPH